MYRFPCRFSVSMVGVRVNQLLEIQMQQAPDSAASRIIHTQFSPDPQLAWQVSARHCVKARCSRQQTVLRPMLT